MLPKHLALREDAGMDFEAAGLLDGLEGDRRRAREQLLERLAADGASLDELKSAVAEQRLALLPVQRLLGGRYTADEIEEQTGVPAGLLVQQRRLLGLPKPGPEEKVFDDEDIETAKSLKLFLDSGFDVETIAQVARVLGEGTSRLAATTGAAFVETFLRAGDNEYDAAARFEELTGQLLPAARPILVAAFKQHLREAVRRGMLGRLELETGQFSDAVEIGVCFADLVGFTRLGGEVGVQELGSVAGGLAALAGDVAEEPVRLIKTIGDAAMFVSPEPGPLVAVALSLVEAVEEADMPALRAGIAQGSALVRAGDYYGHTVNLASRVTGAARPGSVLATTEVHDAAEDDFDWSFAGRHRLKGVSDRMPLYRARRVDTPAPAREDRADGRKPAKAAARRAAKRKAKRE
jgi:adenylate cyclase